MSDLGLGSGKYMMSLKHFMMPESKKCSKTDGFISRSQPEGIPNTFETVCVKKDNNDNGLKYVN